MCLPTAPAAYRPYRKIILDSVTLSGYRSAGSQRCAAGALRTCPTTKPTGVFAMAKQTRASARARPNQRPADRKPARMPTLPPPGDTIVRLHRAVLEELQVDEVIE